MLCISYNLCFHAVHANPEGSIFYFSVPEIVGDKAGQETRRIRNMGYFFDNTKGGTIVQVVYLDHIKGMQYHLWLRPKIESINSRRNFLCRYDFSD